MKIIPSIKPIDIDSQSVSQTEPGFPSARYFQIHFEHLYEMIDELRHQLDQANQRIAELQGHLQDGSVPPSITSEHPAGQEDIPVKFDR